MRPPAGLGLRIITILTAVSFLALMAAMFITTPDELGPFGITVWFLTLLVFVGSLLTLTIYYLSKRFNSRKASDQRLADSMRYGYLSGTWLTALAALNSLRQLGLKDIVLVSLLVGLIEFYLRRVR